MKNWKEEISVVENFPKDGISFKDISTLLANPEATKKCLDEWIQILDDKGLSFDKIAVIDSRGFIFGSMLADRLSKGLILVRKFGKLPPETLSEEYSMEYSDKKIVEIRKATINQGDKVLVVDDLLATGGTLKATIRLLKKAGSEVVGATCLIRLRDLFSDEEIENVGVYTLLDL